MNKQPPDDFDPPPEDTDAQLILVRCPRCGTEQVDLDGFGFINCERCHYCTHPSFTGERCDVCGTEEDGLDAMVSKIEKAITR